MKKFAVEWAVGYPTFPSSNRTRGFPSYGFQTSFTISIRYLASKFIRTIDGILSPCIITFLGLKSLISRQLSAFYKKRFLRCLNPLIMLLKSHNQNLSWF